MVRDETLFARSKNLLRPTPHDQRVQIDMKDLELRARQVEIHDLSTFYASPMFSASFILDRNARKIVQVS